MKKTYLKPELEVTEMVVESLMAAESGYQTYPSDATKPASSKEYTIDFDVWESDETEE